MAEKQSFPNIPVSHWHSLRRQFKKSIPGAVTANYIASILGMTEQSARTNILPSLRMVGLIDENDKTNQEMAKSFRDDGQYRAFCATILDKYYPQGVRDAFPDSDSDREKVKTWFMNEIGIGQSAARRIVSFYFALLEADANVETTQPKLRAKNTVPQSRSRKSDPSTVPKTLEKNSQSNPIDSESLRPNVNDDSLPSLNINVQIHISSDATPDQIEQIFASMSKHIYKKK